MGLPFILDIAIGLVFIYLILSLLASELQELITTLLQWRAKHLKDSIEVLLAGGTGTAEEEKVRDLVNELYGDPLIKNINQEAKGFVERTAREITRWLIPGNRRGAFGKNQATGPSYIASDTFATSLIDRLKLSTLVDKLTEVRLEKFIIRIVGTYTINQTGKIEIPDDSFIQELKDDWKKGRIRLIAEKSGKSNLDQDPSFGIIVEEYDDILRDYKTGQATLTTCVERMGESLKNYSSLYSKQESEDPNPASQAPDPASEEAKNQDFFRRLESFRFGIFGEKNERAIVSGGLRPSLSEIAELINQSSTTYKEVADAYRVITTEGESLKQMVDADMEAQLQTKNEGDENKDLPSIKLADLNNEERRLYIDLAMNRLNLTKEQRELYENYETYQSIEQILSKIPNSVKDSLVVLARRAQDRAQKTSDEVNQFRSEVAIWFDRSMARTSGVYKRNAKGVALIIGFLLALITNADSFYVVDRLSSDENLRQVIAEEAAKIAPNSNDSGADTNSPLKDRLKRVKSQTDAVLKELTLPIGWKPVNLSQQFKCAEGNPPTGSVDNPEIEPDLVEWQNLFNDCLPKPKTAENASQPFTGNEFVPTRVAEVAIRHPIALIRMLSGWIVSGIAIGMGAPFWFDLLGKIVNVRNTGSKPSSEATKETAK